MKVAIKRIDKGLPLPTYETKGSLAFDLLCREDTIIKKGEIGLIPCNVIVEVPEGYVLLVTSRSSTPRKKGLLIPHGAGIIDRDYCGPKDEIFFQVYNFSNQEAQVKRGEKVAQGLLVKIGLAEWEEVDQIQTPSRGGFGSTDKNPL